MGYVKFLSLTVLFHIGGFSTLISQLPQACWELTWPSSVGATSRSRPGGRSYRIHVIRNRQVTKTLHPRYNAKLIIDKIPSIL